jgi:hypothetical protein
MIMIQSLPWIVLADTGSDDSSAEGAKFEVFARNRVEG